MSDSREHPENCSIFIPLPVYRVYVVMQDVGRLKLTCRRPQIYEPTVEFGNLPDSERANVTRAFCERLQARTQNGWLDYVVLVGFTFASNVEQSLV